MMKSLLSVFSAAVLFVFLSGCSSTPASLQKEEYKTAFEVSMSYQTVLKRIVEGNRECGFSPLLPIGQVINDVEHYPDLKEARIVKGASGIGTQIHQVITVKEVQQGITRVELFAVNQNARERFIAVLKRWSNGSMSCDE